MTLILSEADVGGLLDMKEVVTSVEYAFTQEALGEAKNTMRTRTKTPGSVLNVMHAAVPSLNRVGVKAYVSTPSGTKFAVLLFDTERPGLLAVIGADLLGRYRTGAASAVATKHLYHRSSATLAVFGSGKQALTQVLALAEVTKLEHVSVWSPDPAHRSAFAGNLSKNGFEASASASASSAMEGATVACTITSSKEPFLTAAMATEVSHLNLCGGNHPAHAEASPEAIGSFDTIVLDDFLQGREEYGDLIRAERAGEFSWDSAIELKDVVAGKRTALGRTIFKSGGAAIEDVAVASMLYDKAMKSENQYPDVYVV